MDRRARRLPIPFCKVNADFPDRPDTDRTTVISWSCCEPNQYFHAPKSDSPACLLVSKCLGTGLSTPETEVKQTAE
jgi:hypothetical protein